MQYMIIHTAGDFFLFFCGSYCLRHYNFREVMVPSGLLLFGHQPHCYPTETIRPSALVYSCFHGLVLPPPITVLQACTSLLFDSARSSFSSLCKRAPCSVVCKSWADDLTAPPLRVRSWVASLWLMTSCSELGVC